LWSERNNRSTRKYPTNISYSGDFCFEVKLNQKVELITERGPSHPYHITIHKPSWHQPFPSLTCFRFKGASTSRIYRKNATGGINVFFHEKGDR